MNNLKQLILFIILLIISKNYKKVNVEINDLFKV